MQAVIALCHFCESHGPRVLVTCQPMRSLPMTPMNFAASSSRSGEMDICSKDADQEKHFKNSGERRGTEQVVEVDDLPTFYGDCTRAVYDAEDRCDACTSYGNGPCLLSNDHDNKTTYISSQVALKEQVCERVRNACLRSLSYEIPVSSQECTKKTQPMRIGGASSSLSSEAQSALDMDNVKKKDGYLMFGDTDTGFCLSYAFRLQDAKARGFLRLFSLLIMTQDVSSMATHHDFFLEALRIIKERLQTQSSATYEQEMVQLNVDIRPEQASVAGRIPYSMFTFKRSAISVDPSRNLQTITGNDNIWFTLHRQMMWTLRTQTLRYEDQVMEGVPTQDMLVMMEMEHSDIVELDLDQPNQAEITLQQYKNLKLIANALAEKDERELDLLIKQVITGGQLVVESAHKMLAKQFILAMSNLLPIGCLRINNYADQYYNSYQYNMLGCCLGVNIPLDADLLLIRVSCEGEPQLSLEGCRFDVIRRPDVRLQAKNPYLLDRYKQLLLDDEVHEHVLEATLRSSREQWMSRSKMLYQLEEQAQRDPLFRPPNLIQLVKGCGEHDRPVLTFWKCGLSKAYKNHVIATINELRDFAR